MDVKQDTATQADQLNAVFEAMTDGILVYDAEENVVRMNSAIRQLLGLDTQHATEYVALSVSERKRYLMMRDEHGVLLPFEQWPQHRLLQGEILADANAVDVIVRTIDGRDIQMNISGAPIRDQNGHITGAVAICRDVTERRRLEREIQRRMEEFLSMASHELRTPLTTIKASIQLMKRWFDSLKEPISIETRKVAMMQNILQRADRQAMTLNRLVGDLLDVSRIGADKLRFHLQEHNLTSIVCDIVSQQQQATATRTITLQIKDGCELVPILADAERIGQVITNYLTNALKYSARTCPVEISVECDQPPYVRVAVRDKGPGLSPEEQEHIWERFHQVERVKVEDGSSIGLGVGLYISRTIIERHGGAVGIESIPGEGSTFWFTLPLTGTPFS